MTESAPAGWYDDGSGRLRYWDGEAWTEHFHDHVPTTDDPKAAAAQAKVEKKEAAAAARAEKKAAAAAAWEDTKTQFKEARAEKAAQKAANLAALHERGGKLVKSASFGGKTVEIYENGYVRVALFMTANTPLEELRGITYRRNSRDKGAGGRAAGAMMTGGLSLLASKEKVQAYLSIATDRTVHQLSSSQAMQWEEKAAMALEAAGQSVIDMNRQTSASPPIVVHQTAPTQAPAEKSVAEQIRELAALHAEGILSEEEFASAKAKFLS